MWHAVNEATPAIQGGVGGANTAQEQRVCQRPQLPLCCHLMEFNSNYSDKKTRFEKKGHTFHICKMALGTQTDLQTPPGPCPPPVTPTFTPNPTPPIHTGIPNLSSPSRDLFSSPPSGQSGAQCERKRGWGAGGTHISHRP